MFLFFPKRKYGGKSLKILNLYDRIISLGFIKFVLNKPFNKIRNIIFHVITYLLCVTGEHFGLK